MLLKHFAAKISSGPAKNNTQRNQNRLRKAPVVLLDEVTSSLDVWNSRATQQAISSLAGSGTVIVIAHRIQSVTDYDRIIFVENGSIVEEGTHGELLALNGRYRAMWEAELHGFSQP